MGISKLFLLFPKAFDFPRALLFPPNNSISLVIMKILDLIIEGFKSYGKRVELKNFDPQFNALTGENGTGKSNILEAIFFVLGFSLQKVKEVRVEDKRDLIYKKGTGEVKKA